MHSNYLRTKLSWFEDFIKGRIFIFADACGHQVYITYIHYISDKILEYHTDSISSTNVASSRQASA